MKKKLGGKRKPSANNNSKLKTFGISSLITMVFYLFGFLIAAFICFKADIDKDKYFIIMLVITVLASIFGGYRLTHINNEKGLINGIIGSIPIMLLTVIMAVMFNNGIPTIQTLIAAVASIVSGAASGTVAINLRR